MISRKGMRNGTAKRKHIQILQSSNAHPFELSAPWLKICEKLPTSKSESQEINIRTFCERTNGVKGGL